MLLACCSDKSNVTAAPQYDGRVEPRFYTYEVVADYPHPRNNYTQGLLYIDNKLWEGTGQYGDSRLERTDLATGERETLVRLPDSEFGEGITLLGNRIYQLTWTNGKMHIYDRETLRKVRDWSYSGEGWGLANDGKLLYMSDGSSKIRIIDPATMQTVRTFDVKLRGESLNYLNELEWINGRLWANVYMYDQIVIINPNNGIVEGVIDLTGILPAEERDATTDVLNGIAYDKATGRVFVTGKNWSKLFVINLVEIL